MWGNITEVCGDTFSVAVGQYFVIGFVTLVSYLCVKHRELIRVSVKTLPRDLSGIRFFFTLQILGLWMRIRNRTVFQAFDRIVEKYPDKVCFYFEEESWTFKEVLEYANRVANYFSGQGYVKGDKIAVLMDNRPEYVGTWLGLSKIGVVASLINTNLRHESLQHVLQLLPHKGIIYEDEIAYKALNEVIASGYKPGRLYVHRQIKQLSHPNQSIDLDAELKKESGQFVTGSGPQIRFNDPLYHCFTSGTTGFPKAAVLKHSRYFMSGVATGYIFGIKSSDIQYSPLPLYHNTAGMLGMGATLFHGTSIVLRKKFSASQFWKDCAKYNVTVAQYLGETLRYLLNQAPTPQEGLHKVRKLYGLGLRPDLWSSISSRFGITDIVEFYAASEGNCNLVNFDGQPGACGFLPRWAQPFMSYEIVKVAESGEIVKNSKSGFVVPCKINEPGELIGKIFSGHPLLNFEGYSDRAATEKKIVRNAFRKGDSYFRSGDILKMDELGYFYFLDRCGDTFRWKSENVSSQQVESVLSSISGIMEVAVVGVQVPGADGRAGMAVISTFGKNGKIDWKHFAAEVVAKLPSYARPLFIRVKDQIDVTSTFKVKKTELQKEGFDITVVKDPIYFLNGSEYVPLTETLFEAIANGKIRF